jgi:hypothetical protein
VLTGTTTIATTNAANPLITILAVVLVVGIVGSLALVASRRRGRPPPGRT